MKKKLLCIGLGVMLAVSTLSFAACGGDDKTELQKQLSAAQTLVEQQETEISELEKDKAELQKQIDEMNKSIDLLENQIFLSKTVEVCEEGIVTFSVTVNQTKVKVGDKITATLTLENTSGQDIEAQIPDWIYVQNKSSKEDILESALIPDLPDYVWGHTWVATLPPPPTVTIKKGEKVQTTVELDATEAGAYRVHARACFYMDKEKHFNYIEPIKVIVKG